jgi:hypothetical protein
VNEGATASGSWRPGSWRRSTRCRWSWHGSQTVREDAERDFTSLRAFGETTPGVRALVLAYNGREAVKVGEKLFVIPLGLLLS